MRHLVIGLSNQFIAAEDEERTRVERGKKRNRETLRKIERKIERSMKVFVCLPVLCVSCATINKKNSAGVVHERKACCCCCWYAHAE